MHQFIATHEIDPSPSNPSAIMLSASFEKTLTLVTKACYNLVQPWNFQNLTNPLLTTFSHCVNSLFFHQVQGNFRTLFKPVNSLFPNGT